MYDILGILVFTKTMFTQTSQNILPHEYNWVYRTVNGE